MLSTVLMLFFFFFFLLFLLILFLFFVFLFLFFLFLIFRRISLHLFFRLCNRFSHLIHANNKICVFYTYLFNRVFVVESFALKNHFECFSWHAFDFLYLGFEDVDLNKRSLTLSAGSISTWKTSPFRFFIFSFITTQILFKFRTNSLLVYITCINLYHQLPLLSLL